jgi:hypothetical protein
MQLGPKGWQLVVSEDAVDLIGKRLRGPVAKSGTVGDAPR